MAEFTIEKVRPQLQLLALLANGLDPYLPDDETLKTLIKFTKDMMVEEWFASFVCYTFNTFRDKPPTREQLADALEFFAKKLRATAATFPVQGQKVEG